MILKIKGINHIIWLTGQSGSGKTTVAELLSKKLNAVVLDGDEMRNSISLEMGFSKEDRNKHNLRVARLASVLCKRHPVVVSVIAPFSKTREEINKIIDPIWVYIERTSLPSQDIDKPYEIPVNPHITINSDTATPEENMEKIFQYIFMSDKI